MERLKVAAFIPVRGGSKSIPLKNIKNIAGKPLVYWTIEAALECSFIDKVFVSTDSQEIEECVTKLNNPKLAAIDRGPETATDTATSESALIEFCHKYEYDYIFFIQATSPLLTSQDLTVAWEKYRSHKLDSLLSVVRQKRFIWQENQNGTAEPLNYNPLNRPRRQEFQGYLVENGAFYLSACENILSSGCRISDKTGIYEMCEESYFELDEPSDWLIIENLLLNRSPKHESNDLKSLLRDVKLLVMDVDGVLTDAGMYYSENGDELKKFNTLDGKGLELIREQGIKTAIITSEKTSIVEKRAQKLKIDYVYQGILDKQAVLRELSSRAGVDLSQIAYIGDDVNDLPAIDIAGFTFCPAGATAKVKRRVDLVLNNRGGEGAVREVCELLLGSLE